jgi:hypothetical protein
MELVSPLLRNDFREFCVYHFVLRQIDDIFIMAGVRRGNLPRDRIISGQRRTLVEEYYTSLNWHSDSDADKFLKILGYSLAQRYDSEEPRRILRGYCEREGLIVDGINVYRKSHRPPASRVVAINPAKLAELSAQLIGLDRIDLQRRGFEFERFLKDLFEAHNLAPRSSFRLLGEQIDGSLQLTECRRLLGRGQVAGKADRTKRLARIPRKSREQIHMDSRPIHQP